MKGMRGMFQDFAEDIGNYPWLYIAGMASSVGLMCLLAQGVVPASEPPITPAVFVSSSSEQGNGRLP